MIEQNISTLKIHRLTQEQYDRELAAGRIDENAIYLTPEEELDLSDYATLDQLKNKVDKVSGKDLSTNDYTTAEKNKLANIEEGAQVNQNAFAEIYVNGQPKPAVSPDSSIEVKPGAGISVGIEAGDNATYDLNITNTGILEIASGTVNGTISVTKHNTTTNVAVKGLGSAAYTAASAYDAAGAADEALESAKEYTDTSIANLVNSAPETLDTLSEIANALAENEDVVDTLNQAISNKVDKSDLIQSDWNENDETSLAYIKNKPDVILRSEIEEIDAIILVTETGLVSPAAAEDGSIYIDENDAIYSL